LTLTGSMVEDHTTSTCTPRRNDSNSSDDTRKEANEAATTNTNGDGDNHEFSLLAGFNEAITAITVCSPGACFFVNANDGDKDNENNNNNKNNNMDISTMAHRQAKKAMCALGRQMTVSKAIVEDVEVLYMLAERIFS